MIFRTNAGLVAIIFLELIFAGVLTRFAIDLPSFSQPANDNSHPLDSKDIAPDDYILLVATNYRNDRDLALARERLALFRDDDIAARVSQLARAYALQKKPQAAELATLAVALGSDDQAVTLIALGSIATPETISPPAFTGAIGVTPTVVGLASSTPFRTAAPTRIPFTATRKPTATSTRTQTAAATATKTVTPTPSALSMSVTSTPTNTVVPSATPTLTQTATSSASVNTTWLPSDRSQWPPSMGYQPTNPAAGQQYWRLVTAVYCDYTEQRYDCPSRPGGPAGTNTYVMLIDSQGNRAEAPLLLNGGPSGQEQKAATDMCNCNYSFPDDDWNIQMGSAPSDSISGLALYSVKFGLRQYHVRYFLTFQLLVK